MPAPSPATAVQVCVEQALAWQHLATTRPYNVERALRMDCYVAAEDGSKRIPEIADAASDLLALTVALKRDPDQGRRRRQCR